MPRLLLPRLPLTALLVAALLVLAATGCQNNRAAVIPPPGGALPGDPYYHRPAATSDPSTPTGAPAAAAGVSLSPGGLRNLPPPPTTSGASASSRTPRDTYDVTTRVAADSQPIRVLDSTSNPSRSLATAPRGMALNDGTKARPWQAGAAVPPSLASNPLGQLRGGSSTSGSLPQGFSGQDGQWRSRSSYEATERR